MNHAGLIPLQQLLDALDELDKRRVLRHGAPPGDLLPHAVQIAGRRAVSKDAPFVQLIERIEELLQRD